jgi:hypothetical protein
MPLSLLDTITVHRAGGPPRRIELRQGDLTDLGPPDAVDVLVVSAFPNDYSPVRGSLIGALHARGLSVAELARDCIDLRRSFSCWLSREIPPEMHARGLRFKRLLCFEPQVSGLVHRPREVIDQLYAALTPFMFGPTALTSVAMPLLSTGKMRFTIEQVVPHLLDGALSLMRSDSPLRIVKIVCVPEKAEEVRTTFDRVKAGYAQHDVFISYSHADASRVNAFCEKLRARIPGIKLYRDILNLQAGTAWDEELLRAAQTSKFFVPFYSTAYVCSDMCQTEFYMALMAHERSGMPLFFPVLLDGDARLTKTMRDLHYEDGRQGKEDLLDRAVERLADRLLGRVSSDDKVTR